MTFAPLSNFTLGSTRERLRPPLGRSREPMSLLLRFFAVLPAQENCMPTLKVIIASTRPGRAGLPIGTWITEVARKHAGFDTVEVLDLAEIGLPLMNEPNHPRLRQYQFPHTLAWSRQVDSADAFVVVAPEYNFSISAPLKNAFDYLSAEWAYKTMGLVTYGGISGGMRAGQAIRGISGALRVTVATESVALPMVFPQIKDGVFTPAEGNLLAATAMLDELVTLDRGLSPLREPAGSGPYDHPNT
ncbi:NADPH-dependent FMN reductase [Streptomyces sp. NPDC007896]|uniref:NADPH-dependent FMN reductase n=1 Tax=Streptomyces sp. NPDC007896 TaxID=3364784 RepID=UPI0036E75E65